MGVIAVETRSVERKIPADPGNPESREVVEAQAGQVWYPDSAYKTATAIRDFNQGENLPLIIFANWRGFSGGTRDMYGEILKFGSQIVDALVDFKPPIFIYIPPGGELRGGSWVVLDPAINPDVMEMYADVEARGGILEPAGVVEVKFREKQRKDLMHRLDDRLIALDAQLKVAGDDASTAESLRAQVVVREEQLEPLYMQVACEFADLHDRPGRMKAVGAIREGLEWKSSREFFYWRVRRRLLEQRLERDVLAANQTLLPGQAKSLVNSWLPKGTDKEVVEFLEKNSLADQVKAVHARWLRQRISELREELHETGGENPLSACLAKCVPWARSLVGGEPGKVEKTASSGRSPRAAATLPGLLGTDKSGNSPKKGATQV